MAILMLTRLALLVLALLAAVADAAVPAGWRGHWEGDVTFRGDAWPVRIALADGDAATIDLPALWLAGEPLPVATDGDAVTVTLPFGLGDVALARCDAGLCGQRSLGDDSLAVALRPAAALESSDRAIELRSGDATLHGTLRMPDARGATVPAVVLVHGAGNNTRADWNYRSSADFWLRRGHAVLLYDKRGSGASTGPWMTTSFPDLRDLGADLRVALDWLATQPGIDPSRIGVHGGSQALWTIALAADAGPGPAFAVISGAPATTPLEQERDSVLRRIAAADLDDADRAAARDHVAAYFAAVQDPARTDAAIAFSRRAEGAPWATLVPTAATGDDFYWWRRNHALDPAPLLRTWRFPALFLHGGADEVSVPGTHVPRLRALLRPDIATFHAFPGAAHNLELPGGRDAGGQWRFPRRHPGVAPAIDAWLSRLPRAPGA